MGPPRSNLGDLLLVSLLVTLLSYLPEVAADYLLTQRMTDSTCTTPLTASIREAEGSYCVPAAATGTSINVVCSSSTNWSVNTYAGLTCSGSPTASRSGQIVCASSPPYYQLFCVTTSDPAPFGMYRTDAVIQQSFSPGATCAAPGPPRAVLEIPLNTCVPEGSGTRRYAYNSGLLSSIVYNSADCSGTGVQFNGPINMCLDADPSPIVFTITSASSSLAPVLTAPSAADLPPPASGFSSSGCGRSAVGTNTGKIVYYCGDYNTYTDRSEQQKTFSVAIFNPFVRTITVRQTAVTGCAGGDCTVQALPAAELVEGRNLIYASQNLWISLQDVPCKTPSNPFDYCAVSISDTADFSQPHFFYWTRVYLRSYSVVSVAAVVVGSIVGILFLGFAIIGVLHVAGYMVCPCFNVCCDRRKRAISQGYSGYTVSRTTSNPATIGAAYAAQFPPQSQAYAPQPPQANVSQPPPASPQLEAYASQPQQHGAPPPTSLTAKWDPTPRRL